MWKFLHHGICFPLEKIDIKENEPSNRLVINSKKKKIKQEQNKEISGEYVKFYMEPPKKTSPKGDIEKSPEKERVEDNHT